MCFQGGCGSCLVEVKLFEPITEQKLSYAVNSVSRVNPGKYGQRYKYGQRATNAHTKASLGCDSNASISPIICTFGFFADCILLDSVPLK